MTIGIAVLAAGSSARMGRAKQLLPWDGTTLIRSVVARALASGAGPVAVVLGAHADAIGHELRGEPVEILRNDAHAAGPGTSIHAATRWSMARDWDGLLLTLGDQPFVRGEDLHRLVAAAASAGAAAAGTRYGDGAGVPAFFDRSLFPRLLRIPDDGGAKGLLRSLPGVALIDLPHALVDLDTPAEYEAAMRRMPV